MAVVETTIYFPGSCVLHVKGIVLFMEVMFLHVTGSIMFTEVMFTRDRNPHFDRSYITNMVCEVKIFLFLSR